jgi:hypothetical protein
VMAQLAEVLLAQAVQSGAVELRGASDEVVHLGLEGPPAGVVPDVRRHVTVVHEDILREPVLRLPSEPVTPLQHEDPLARRSKVPRQGAAAGAASDHDHVVVIGAQAETSASRSAMMMRAAASISARCEKA